MRNVVVLLVISVVVILISLSLFPLSMESKKARSDFSLNSGNKAAELGKTRQLSETLEATFKIYIHGLPKDFEEKSYFNQSPDVYISPESPQTVHVTVGGTTWQDLFMTMPIIFSSECLVSEVNQEFCQQDDLKLYYYLNGKLEDNIFPQEIKNGDTLLVTYGDLTKAEINYQLSQLE